MIILQPYQTCPYGDKCKYSMDCWGLESSRETEFVCQYVDSNGVFNENAPKPLGKTGKMKILLEDDNK